MMNRGGGHRYLYDDRLASTVSFLVQTPGSARLVARIHFSRGRLAPRPFYFFWKNFTLQNREAFVHGFFSCSNSRGSARLVLRILAFYFFGKISLFKMTIGRG